MSSYPGISVIITTYNAGTILDHSLSSIVRQNYPKDKLEIVLVDDRSTDNTLEVAKKYDCTILVSGKRICDVSRSLGIRNSKYEFLFFVDADNVLPNDDFLINAVKPFMEENDMVGVFPFRFFYNDQDHSSNRYCSLYGLNDPFQFYMKAREHLAHCEEDWQLLGKAVNKDGYFSIEFSPSDRLTLGAIGFLAKKSIIMKYDSEDEFFFHSDVCNELIAHGYNKFAASKQEIIHNHCDSHGQYFRKLSRNYTNYLKHSSKRKANNNWATNNKFQLTWSIILMSSFLVPLKDSLKGFLKKPDLAWFLHPFYCIAVTAMYLWITLKFYLFENTGYNDNR